MRSTSAVGPRRGSSKLAVAPRRRRRGRWVLAALVLLMAAAGLGIAAREDTASRGLAPVDGPDPGVEHVHGLGVDPAYDGVLAATHFGLFQISSDGDAKRVANRYQDTMGFTVVGPRHYLASGHPDLRELPDGETPLLGLIESKDGGVTWDRRSLGGKADFHALQAIDADKDAPVVIGYDSTSQSLQITRDMRTWTLLATRPLVGFAADPAGSDTLVALEDGGMLRSEDLGKTLTRSPMAALAHVSWDKESGLWGVGPEGRVWRSDDSGLTWAPQGDVTGSITAFSATPKGLFAAAEDGTIYRSDDGKSWSKFYAA